VPVNLDIPRPEVRLVDEDDPHVNLLGVKRLGEISLIDVTRAVADAVFRTTGGPVCNWPIRIKNLLYGMRFTLKHTVLIASVALFGSAAVIVTPSAIAAAAQGALALSPDASREIEQVEPPEPGLNRLNRLLIRTLDRIQG
jgi:hypothetical protein